MQNKVAGDWLHPRAAMRMYAVSQDGGSTHFTNSSTRGYFVAGVGAAAVVRLDMTSRHVMAILLQYCNSILSIILKFQL